MELKMIYFLTGSKKKFNEAKEILPDLEQLDIDLPEIQHIDPKAVIEAKLLEALKHQSGLLIVEDTSLYLDCLNGLPGPLIKWFMKTIGNDGIFKIAESFGDFKAAAKTVIGFAQDKDNLTYFEGMVEGEIVVPRGETDFGWDPIFLPAGHKKTFAEMGFAEKNSLSMRKQAFEKLKEFIQAS
jgi:inosine triphosphate pyrophosphatase